MPRLLNFAFGALVVAAVFFGGLCLMNAAFLVFTLMAGGEAGTGAMLLATMTSMGAAGTCALFAAMLHEARQ